MTKDVIKESDDVEDVEVKEELVIVETNQEEDKPLKDIDDEKEEKTVEVDPEREAIRERRRLEKLERKERREKAIGRDKIELDFLRKRNDELERRMTAQELRAKQADVSIIDQQLNEAITELKMAEQVIAKAVDAGNGSDVTQAMRYRDQAMIKAQQLYAHKQSVADTVKAPQKSQNFVDDQTMRHAKEFLSDNKWYDAQGRDEDSAIMLAIDQSLAKEGFDPRTEEYWDELRIRGAKRLPERFASISKPRETRGGPAVGSGREHAPASTRKDVYISAERKQALIEAGVWDDPVLRMKYVKRYSEYDKAHKL